MRSTAAQLTRSVRGLQCIVAKRSPFFGGVEVDWRWLWLVHHRDNWPLRLRNGLPYGCGKIHDEQPHSVPVTIWGLDAFHCADSLGDPSHAGNSAFIDQPKIIRRDESAVVELGVILWSSQFASFLGDLVRPLRGVDAPLCGRCFIIPPNSLRVGKQYPCHANRSAVAWNRILARETRPPRAGRDLGPFAGAALAKTIALG